MRNNKFHLDIIKKMEIKKYISETMLPNSNCNMQYIDQTHRLRSHILHLHWKVSSFH